MSREENPQEDLHDLNELEAALAALVPRTERLNRDRLMFLAGQASVEPRICQPVVAQITNLPYSRQVGKVPHVVGWAWPAAFTTMAGIAALLLAAQVMRPAARLVERPAPTASERIAALPAAPREPAAAMVDVRIEPYSVIDSLATVPTLPSWLAWALFPQPDISAKHEPTYPELRKQALLHGLETWKPRPPESAAAGRTQEEPALDREQWNRWLEQEGLKSTVQRHSTPTLRNPSGARS